ncbi:NUDIX hydrolase [Lacticaseibacillus suihuaensis]
MTDRFYPTELTCFCLVQSQGKLLVQHKTDSEFAPSLTFPGGHSEPGESLTACATRELEEECGLTVTDWRLAALVNFRRTDGNKELIVAFAATLPTPRPTQVTPGTKNEGETAWLPLAQVAQAPMNAVVRGVWDAYRQGTPRELYFD